MAITSGEPSRIRAILDRVLAIPEEELPAMLERLWREFSSRHRDFERVLDDHYRLVSHHLDRDKPLSRERRLLIGAYFTHEYSIEGAALFNPVDRPGAGSVRPAAGGAALRHEHAGGRRGAHLVDRISLGRDRTGRRDRLRPDEPVRLHRSTHARTPRTSRNCSRQKLREVGVDNEVSRWVLARVPDEFSTEELRRGLRRVEDRARCPP